MKPPKSVNHPPSLTLICPSYNRHSYLQRSIGLWSSHDQFAVHYADGSPLPLKIDLSPYTNIRYSHMSESFARRVLMMLEEVNTPYVCLLGDDEFFIPSALTSCISYLDDHDDYVACMGRAVGFYRLGNYVNYRKVYPRLRNRNLSSTNPYIRLRCHFGDYVPAHLYAVTRTSVFKKAMRYALETKLELFAIFELIEEFLVVSAGKTRILPQLHWLRSFEAPPVRNMGDKNFDTSKSFSFWWLSDDSSSIKSREAFCKEISSASCSSVSTKEVNNIFDAYVSALRSNPKMNNYIRFLIRAIAFKVNSLLPHSLAHFLFGRRAITLLESQGVRIDYAALDEFSSSIKASY